MTPATSTAETRLTAWAGAGGSATKWEHTSLSGLLGELAAVVGRPSSGGLLIGLDEPDDAAVLELRPDLALVSTTSFFPPAVDDPATSGAIAAAAACSNVFAMGGRVVLALNIAAVPEQLPADSIASMLSGAAEVVAAAGGTVAGGHTVRSDEVLFGLAVQGIVDPRLVLSRGGARPGDVLVLSKPIGTGVVLTGGTEDERGRVAESMTVLNRLASERLVQLGPECHAVTDVSGFGLLGHAHEMAERSGCCLDIDAEMVPCYRGAKQLAGDGVRSAGEARNRASFQPLVLIGDDVSVGMEALAFDPQTSGGLLASVEPDAVAGLVDAGFKPIGTVREVDADDDGYATEPMVQLH